EMKQFAEGKTKIMVSTTVIEVGINVPNASVMVIENAERFGLSQLHQLRGRVGRGAEQSFCILSSSFKLTSEARTRLETMVKTNDGFEIAEVDLRLRGPGDMGGTQQSGIVDFKLADLVKDEALITTARNAVYDLLREDPRLEAKENFVLKKQLHHLFKDAVHWSRIS
ncbi:MAG: helicase-related protein, partial [Bacteroidota bacterium]